MAGKRKTGRPTAKTEATIVRILARVAEGESVRAILKDETLPARSTWCEWLVTDDELAKRYAAAVEIGAANEFDEIMEIADTPQIGEKRVKKADGTVEITAADMLEHRKLRVTARQWRLTRLVPGKYNDTLNLRHTGADGKGPVQIDDTASAARIAALLAAAEARMNAAGAED